MLNEPLYIICKTCLARSCNPNDIREKFCGRCSKFHASPDAYEMGPTPEALGNTGFTCERSDGRTWYCPRPVAGHSRHPCESCIVVIDDVVAEVAAPPPGMDEASSTLYFAMVAACRAYLSPGERATVQRAIANHEDEMTDELLKCGGHVLNSEEWARFALLCAHNVLKAKEAST